MGFCTDTNNPTLMGFMAEQCALSCGFVNCPGNGIGGETTTLTTTLTTTPSTTSVTTSAPASSAPTTSEPSTSPSAARGRLVTIQVPTAVSALDAASLDITVGWDADLDVGPVELVPRFALIPGLGALLRTYDDGSEGRLSLPRANQGNVVWQAPIHLNSSSGVTTITLTFKRSKLPLVPGV